MATSLECPNCHAALQYDEKARAVTIRCEYCNSTVIVPETLRTGRSSASYDSALQAQVLAEAAQLIQQGKKIEAIKRFREAFHVGLKEAKDVIDAIERHETVRLGGTVIGSSGVEYTPGRTHLEGVQVQGNSRAGCIIWGVVAVIILAVIVPLLLGGGLAFFGISQVTTAIEEVVVRESTAQSGQNEPGIPAPTEALFTPTPAATPTPGFGDVVLRFGGREGSGPGFFNDTRRLAVDGEGNLYTGDYTGGRIQVFAPDGQFMRQINTGSDVIMVGLTVDRQGMIFVVRSGRGIEKFDGATGQSLGPIPGTERENFRSVAAAVDGSVVAYSPNRLLRLDSQGGVTLDIADPFANIADFRTTHDDLAIDGAGNIYILGSEAIYKFDNQGRFINRFGSKGTAEDQFRSAPTALAVDGQGRIYANDFDGIKVFDANGRFLAMIDLPGVSFDMVVTDDNMLVVMDRNSNEVIKYLLNEQ